jgi:hypothetical protein
VTSTSNPVYSDTGENNFIITGAPAPGIAVSTPGGGENWQAGTSHTISWTYSGNPGSYVKIELLKGGVLNRVISSSRAISGGSYNWTVPSTQISGSDYRIKVTSTSNPVYSDTGENNFIITGVAAPAIAITTPRANETWQAGTTHAINWSFSGSPGAYVKIELFKGGVLNRVISSSRAIGSNGAGSYTWTIPSSTLGGTDYKIKITSSSNSAYSDISDNNFTITH